jgi:hypothetical protein
MKKGQTHGFSHKFKPSKVKFDRVTEEGYIYPRDYQGKCRNLFSGERFVIFTGACGCGKTTLSKICAIDDFLLSNRKQLHVFPQSHIGEGAALDEDGRALKVVLDGQKYIYSLLPEHVFCSPDIRNTVKKIKRWLLTPIGQLKKSCSYGDVISITGVNAICCYQTLVLAWKEMTKSERKRAIKNLNITIDEAHHLSNIFEEGELNDIQSFVANAESTELAKILKYMLNNTSQNTGCCLITATPFRGDRKVVISKLMQQNFKIYSYSWS